MTDCTDLLHACAARSTWLLCLMVCAVVVAGWQALRARRLAAAWERGVDERRRLHKLRLNEYELTSHWSRMCYEAQDEVAELRGRLDVCREELARRAHKTTPPSADDILRHATRGAR